MTQKLIANRILQYNLYPCLFIGDKVICIVYVDNLIFWEKYESDMHDLAMKLFDLGADLEEEEDASGFLGVNLERDEETGLLKMKKTGFINFVMSAVGLDDDTDKVKYTPTGYVPLVKNEDGVPASGSFKYSSVERIMIYLSGHTCPDIDFAVNCCATYMFCAKHFHGEYLQRIGQY